MTDGLGRRDWDFVTMADYQSDMQESSGQALAAISFLREKLDRAERMIPALVKAAGGRIEVPDAYLEPLQPIPLKTEFREYDCKLILTTKP